MMLLLYFQTYKLGQKKKATRKAGAAPHIKFERALYDSALFDVLLVSSLLRLAPPN